MSRVRNKKRRTVEEVVEKKFESVKPLNEEQQKYIELIARNYVTVCTGKTGSGKTSVACGMAAQYLLNNRMRQIILTRPAVGAEDLGYLPGDGEKKIYPYLMPMLVELNKFCDVKSLMRQEKIIVIPLAYMRGCNTVDAIVLADECQNASIRLLKLLLTRLSKNSKMIITGDIKQSDLTDRECDFSFVINKILNPLSIDPENRIGIINLLHSVRHPLVEKIADKFEEFEGV